MKFRCGPAAVIPSFSFFVIREPFQKDNATDFILGTGRPLKGRKSQKTCHPCYALGRRKIPKALFALGIFLESISGKGGKEKAMQYGDTNLDMILNGIKPIEKEWYEKAREKTSQLVMPERALGRLHDISEKMCAIRKSLEPEIGNKGCLIMAGDHGVVQEGVSAYPQEVTGEMIKTFLRGGAAINILASHVGAVVRVVDMGIISDLDPGTIQGGEILHVEKIGRGTANFVKGPAMQREDAERAVIIGFQQARKLFENVILK